MTQIKSKQALLVVDIQADFTGQTAKMPIDRQQANEIITNINKLIDLSPVLGLTVVYIGNEYRLLDPLNIFRNFAAIAGSEGAKLDPKLKIVDRNYFPKTTSNSFSNPELTIFLKQHQIDRVLVTGVYAEACIMQTIKGCEEWFSGNSDRRLYRY
jgi:nicotinamidase-related amidase